METFAATVRGDLPGAAIGVGDGVVAIEDADQALEQLFISIVVRFGDPNVFAAREADAFVPLLESAAGIRLR